MALIFCKRCCMDGSAEEIVLSDTGCNFCDRAFQDMLDTKINKIWLSDSIEEIKRDGQGKQYDVLIGLSGGVDSSTVLHNAIKLGLRPLCYSVDNGWNSPESDENIMKLVEGLKVPFYRYTIDLPRFKALQAAFIQAGVPNIEIPTDHILMATTLEMAAKYDIKWILSGGNAATESIMPASWGHNARDLTHIKDIYKKMTGKRLKGLPVCSIWKWNYYRWLKGIKTFYLLDYLDYNRQESERMLTNVYGFKSTGEKHEESMFTRWFQSFYLFEKFSIDKRKAHYASLIMSGQMTRKEAMNKLADQPIYPALGLEQKIRRFPKRKHEDYKIDPWYDRISNFVRLWKS